MKRVIFQRGLLSIMAALLLQGSAWAQASADAALLGMREAFRRNNAATLTALLPRVQGHTLEPLARYWEAKARLETASPAELREAMGRMAGTYWEDRLRNDWLLLLGQRRDWATFAEELPRFRMNDDRQVQCYALMLDAVGKRTLADVAARQVGDLWLAQRDAEDGCATAAQALFDSGHLGADQVWPWKPAERAR
jgi:soluble lytic murein transglycosylase